MIKAASLKVTIDNTEEFNQIVKSFRRDAVLVGIPEEKTDRTIGEKEPVNNATLLAINNFGSPMHNIPARPVMQIGLKNAQPEVIEQFRQAALAAFEKGPAGVFIRYERAGIIAANSIKKAINSQEGIEAPAPATLFAREALGFKGTKALVVTGQMRNAITSIVTGVVG